LPGYLGPVSHLIDTQAHAIEHIADRQPPFAHHLGERLGIGTVGPLPFRGDRSRRRIEGDNHAGIRLNQRQSARKRCTGACERTGACDVEDNNCGLQIERSQRPHVIGNPNCFQWHIGVACDTRIDWGEVVFAFKLQPVAAEIDVSNRIRTGSLYLFQKIAECAPQGVQVEVARTDHIEARRLQRLRDKASVIRWRSERARLIPGIANDQGKPMFRILRCRNAGQDKQKQGNDDLQEF